VAVFLGVARANQSFATGEIHGINVIDRNYELDAA
jgi:hypothetical protein